MADGAACMARAESGDVGVRSAAAERRADSLRAPKATVSFIGLSGTTEGICYRPGDAVGLTPSVRSLFAIAENNDHQFLFREPVQDRRESGDRAAVRDHIRFAVARQEPAEPLA